MFTLPIYYTKEFKAKPSKTSLVGMNQFMDQKWIRNEIKQSWQADLIKACEKMQPLSCQFKVHYKLYYKNTACDGSNIIALSEKIFLDAIQKGGLIPNDNVLFHIGSSWEIAGQDKTNPRVEITIQEV